MSDTKLGLGETLLRPFTASRPSSRANQTPIQGQSQSETIAAVRAAILTILETTHWPRKSEESVKSLIDVTKQFPTQNAPNPSNNDTTHEPAPANAEQILSTLQDVRTKLDAAASRHGASTKSSAFFHRSETCNQVLKTCREQMTGALAAFHSTRSNMQVEAGTAPPDKPQDHQTPPVVEQEASLNNAEERPDATRTSNQQPAKTGTAPNEESTVKSDPSTDSARRKERLDWANKALKGVEMISGSLPIIGSYVGAAAKVGVACVELAQLADRNEEGAHMLESHTTRLSEILRQFNVGSANDAQIGIPKLIQELQKELQRIQDQIKMMNSSSTFRKTFYSMDHADKLKEFQEKIRVALEQLQLLVNLRTSDLIAEISSRQFREENDRLLNSLGDANYGAQGHAIEDVICLEGTRVAILERIENWIRGGRDSKQVLWILGMAGRGKSTLASTVWNKWQNRASCAIFHFRRGQTELQKRLICAIARQLGTCTASPVKHAILECIRENKDIAQARLETQFQFLVGALKILQHPTPIIVIVDALDECEDVEYAVRFVQLIRQHAGLLPPEVKILLTCRPEAPLILALRRSAEWEEESLDLESNMDESEIRLFMEYELSRIRENRDLPGSWPSREDVHALVEKSQRLFQWARTAVRYIADGSPVDRLDELLALPSTNDGLDGLYKPILSKAYERLKKSRAKTQLFLDILGFLVVAPHPISINIIAYVYFDYDGLHNRTENKSANYLREEILAGLSSLLSLPNTSDSYIRLGHTSLRDLLVSEDRCGEQPYLVNVDHYHNLLATKCVRLMLRDLKKNICNLSDLSKPNTEVQDAVSRYVPEGLRYCSRSWSIHLCASSPMPDLQPGSEEGSLVQFERFSKEKLLGWIEVMSLAGEMKESMAMAKQTKVWLERLPTAPRCTILAILWDDAFRFIIEFQEPLSFGALHLYTTPIAFCPRESKLWEYYGDNASIHFLHGQSRSEWPASLWSRSLGSEVYSVACSPDGKMIVSGSSDGLVRLLDAETGLPVEISFEGQTSIVICIAFSPDGNMVASGSSDGEIRLWDVRTGSGIGKVMNAPHADDRYRMLFSVSFSPDGRTILGGYYRNTIHLWEVVTQDLIGTLYEGPSEISLKAAFSPDGKRIVSGNGHGTIRFWNIETSSPIGEPFEATSRVECIVFSPNGRMIAYTTSRYTAHFINADTGIAIDGAPGGTIPLTKCIAFSPDGTKLACGTLDTIHLWDIETRATIGQPMVGHDSWIESVAFSPDGRTIVSGSWDKTVRTWNVGVRASIEIPSEGAKPRVNCIAVSRNGQMIVTGSDSGTVTLWDADTGFPVGPPWKGHRGVITCVHFSPSGQRIASSSAIKDIRLWDVEKRCPVGEPIEGLPDWIRAIAVSPDESTVPFRP